MLSFSLQLTLTAPLSFCHSYFSCSSEKMVHDKQVKEEQDFLWSDRDQRAHTFTCQGDMFSCYSFFSRLDMLQTLKFLKWRHWRTCWMMLQQWIGEDGTCRINVHRFSAAFLRLSHTLLSIESCTVCSCFTHACVYSQTETWKRSFYFPSISWTRYHCFSSRQRQANMIHRLKLSRFSFCPSVNQMCTQLNWNGTFSWELPETQSEKNRVETQVWLLLVGGLNLKWNKCLLNVSQGPLHAKMACLGWNYFREGAVPCFLCHMATRCMHRSNFQHRDKQVVHASLCSVNG